MANESKPDDRTRRISAIVTTTIFLVLAPGTVAGYIPWRISHWRINPPFLGFRPFRVIGILLIAAGLTVLLESFARFALQGIETPAPIFPTRHLVVQGFYRYVRNPMYATQGLMNVPSLGDWQARAISSHVCLDSHWLFAYEAKLRGWGGAHIDGTEPELLTSALKAGISFIDDHWIGTYGATSWAHPYLVRRKPDVTDDSDDSAELFIGKYE